MTPDPSNNEGLFLMLGEMRGDIKYLVSEFSKQADRITENEARLTRLETFRTQIGLVTVSLGLLVPTLITWVAHKIGLING
ncbi:MAG: hypothetical protein ACK5PF_01885 [bacterium]|jgi:hypothetical protein